MLEPIGLFGMVPLTGHSLEGTLAYVHVRVDLLRVVRVDLTCLALFCMHVDIVCTLFGTVCV